MALPAVCSSPIAAYRGDTLTIPVKVWSDAAMTQPVDLTAFGTVFTSQARTDRLAPIAIAFTVDASLASTGVLTLKLTAAQTAALNGSKYFFDVQAANSDASVVTTIVTGSLVLSGEYTHP